jgi:hypothetical protein
MKRLLVLLVPVVLAATGCAAKAPSAQPADQEPSAVAAATVAPAKAPAPRPEPVRPTSFHLWKFDAPVVPIKLAGSELVPPADPSVLGWWGKPAGARTGTTLLTGHTVHTGGGELDDLGRTPVGSTARVSGVTYDVKSVRTISKAQLARRAPVLFSQSGHPKLVVVTCEGYNPATGEYAGSVVVTATPRVASASRNG